MGGWEHALQGERRPADALPWGVMRCGKAEEGMGAGDGGGPDKLTPWPSGAPGPREPRPVGGPLVRTGELRAWPGGQEKQDEVA